MYILIKAINLFFEVVYLLVLVRCLGSFFVRPGDRIYRMYLTICSLTEPILAPCRRLLDRIGLGRSMLDFSPVLALVLLGVIQSVVVSLLYRLLF